MNNFVKDKGKTKEKKFVPYTNSVWNLQPNNVVIRILELLGYILGKLWKQYLYDGKDDYVVLMQGIQTIEDRMN